MKRKSAAEMAKDEVARLSSDTEDSILLSRAEKTFYLIIATAVAATGIYYLNFGWPNHSKYSRLITWDEFWSAMGSTAETWGQFGDFLGGLLNPLVGIGTIYLILINVRLQRKELRSALKEMINSNQSLADQNEAIAIQNFQNTFFNWISSYREIISDANFNLHNGILHGAPALRAVYKGNFSRNNIEHYFIVEDIQSSFAPFANCDPMMDDAINQKIDDILIDRWLEFKGNYYAAEASTKSLLGLIDWILTNAPSIEVLNEYLSVLAAQLSPIEITFILYEVYMTKGLRLHKLNHHKFFDKITKFDDPSMYFIRLRSITATPQLSSRATPRMQRTV